VLEPPEVLVDLVLQAETAAHRVRVEGWRGDQVHHLPVALAPPQLREGRVDDVADVEAAVLGVEEHAAGSDQAGAGDLEHERRAVALVVDALAVAEDLRPLGTDEVVRRRERLRRAQLPLELVVAGAVDAERAALVVAAVLDHEVVHAQLAAETPLDRDALADVPDHAFVGARPAAVAS